MFRERVNENDFQTKWQANLLVPCKFTTKYGLNLNIDSVRKYFSAVCGVPATIDIATYSPYRALALEMYPGQFVLILMYVVTEVCVVIK